LSHPINTSIAKLFRWYWSLLVNVLVLGGVEIKKTSTILMNLDDSVPLWYNKIKSGRKTANINTKILRSFITIKAHCSMTHLKQQKSFGFF